MCGVVVGVIKDCVATRLPILRFDRLRSAGLGRRVRRSYVASGGGLRGRRRGQHRWRLGRRRSASHGGSG